MAEGEQHFVASDIFIRADRIALLPFAQRWGIVAASVVVGLRYCDAFVGGGDAVDIFNGDAI